jgi:hypothetical protein
MSRGKQILYNRLVPISVKPAQKHRQKLVNRRNDALACRYYFHSNINRLRYDDCLNELSNEFYISTNSIVRCLMLRVDYIKQLSLKGITTAELRKMYPHYNWQGRLL